MAKWADYLITKVLYSQHGRIDKVIVRKDNGETVSSEEIEMTRYALTQQYVSGITFATITKNSIGKWNKLNHVYHTRNFNGEYISIYSKPTRDDLGNIPLYLTKRKSFISYYHKDDEQKKLEFDNLTDDLIVNKSVKFGDIDSDNGPDYIKQLIQNGYLKDTTILIVLVGPKTKCRKHVDWEISGALNYRIGETYAGLIGLILPGHPNFGTGQGTYDLMPARLADNFRTDYAVVADWTEDRKIIQSYVEKAFDNRSSKKDDRSNSRIQMQRNMCE